VLAGMGQEKMTQVKRSQGGRRRDKTSQEQVMMERGNMKGQEGRQPGKMGREQVRMELGQKVIRQRKMGQRREKTGLSKRRQGETGQGSPN
jgi:hypothetical protein